MLVLDEEGPGAGCLIPRDLGESARVQQQMDRACSVEPAKGHQSGETMPEFCHLQLGSKIGSEEQHLPKW